MIVPLKNPKPDFESLDLAIRGAKAPSSVHFVEELVEKKTSLKIGRKWTHNIRRSHEKR